MTMARARLAVTEGGAGEKIFVRLSFGAPVPGRSRPFRRLALGRCFRIIRNFVRCQWPVIRANDRRATGLKGSRLPAGRS